MSGIVFLARADRRFRSSADWHCRVPVLRWFDDPKQTHGASIAVCHFVWWVHGRLQARHEQDGGLGRVWPHMLRHSPGYALSNKGHDFRLLQDFMTEIHDTLGTQERQVGGSRGCGNSRAG